MNTDGHSTRDEADIEALVSRFVAAIRAKDVTGVMSVFAAEVVSFDLTDSLEHRGGAAFAERWQALFGSYPHAIDCEVRDLTICAGHDVAFSHSLNRMGGVLKNGSRSERWLRWTACYRKRNDQWLIVHEQVSVPIDIRTGKALVDLQPSSREGG